MNIKSLASLASGFSETGKMPVVFIGHGNPMNAIKNNVFVQGFKTLGKGLPKPQAIVCVSAHWETYGTKITAMESPKTIHDFGGFPETLYQENYPAPGDPSLAKEIVNNPSQFPKKLDYQWGLDHGTWTVAKHLYPKCDVPIVQMSLDRGLSMERHVELARELDFLRYRGVLVIGSGNIVHNLRMVDWNKLKEPFGYDWAEEANSKIKDLIISRDLKGLSRVEHSGMEMNLAIPTAEHYLPLLYTMGLAENDEQHYFFNDISIGGSLSMCSVVLG